MGFILLEFYTLFKCFMKFRLVWALNGCLIGSKTWDRIVRIFRARDDAQTVWATWVVLCVINHVLVGMRPKMTMKFGFTRQNRYWVFGREQ